MHTFWLSLFIILPYPEHLLRHTKALLPRTHSKPKKKKKRDSSEKQLEWQHCSRPLALALSFAIHSSGRFAASNHPPLISEIISDWCSIPEPTTDQERPEEGHGRLCRPGAKLRVFQAARTDRRPNTCYYVPVSLHCVGKFLPPLLCLTPHLRHFYTTSFTAAPLHDTICPLSYRMTDHKVTASNRHPSVSTP